MDAKSTNRFSFPVLAVMGLAYAIITAAGCGSEKTEKPDHGSRQRSDPGIIDAVTGRTAIEAGQRARQVIRESNQERQKQMDEAWE